MSEVFTLILFAAGVFLAVRSAMLKVQQAAKAAQQPPPLPRRAGRGRSARAAAQAVAEPAEEARPPAAAPAERVVVTHRPRPSVHLDFKGKAALRRAIVAREVLGPPLALRPPRF